MIYTLLFVIWTAVLIAAWRASRKAALALFAIALVFSVALFAHHVTDPLTLSF